MQDRPRFRPDPSLDEIIRRANEAPPRQNVQVAPIKPVVPPQPVQPQKQVNGIRQAFLYGLMGFGLSLLFLLPLLPISLLVPKFSTLSSTSQGIQTAILILWFVISVCLPPAIAGFKTTAIVSQKRIGALAGFFTGMPSLIVELIVLPLANSPDQLAILFVDIASFLLAPTLFGFIGAWVATLGQNSRSRVIGYVVTGVILIVILLVVGLFINSISGRTQ